MKRALTPALNPTGLGSSIAALYAVAVMAWNVTHNHAAIDPQVTAAALGAAGFLYARFKVTPVADPKDGNGQPLKAAPAMPVMPLMSATSGYPVYAPFPSHPADVPMPPAAAAMEPPAAAGPPAAP